MIAKALARLGDYLVLFVMGLAIFAAGDWALGKTTLRDSPGSVALGLIIGMGVVLALRAGLAGWHGRGALR